MPSNAHTPCRYFPKCTNDKCEYSHTKKQPAKANEKKKQPAPCKKFPKCDRGPNCGYYHESVCPKDANCNRINCGSKHTRCPNMGACDGKCGFWHPKQCDHYPDCRTGEECKFWHNPEKTPKTLDDMAALMGGGDLAGFADYTIADDAHKSAPEIISDIDDLLATNNFGVVVRMKVAIALYNAAVKQSRIAADDGYIPADILRKFSVNSIGYIEASMLCHLNDKRGH